MNAGWMLCLLGTVALSTFMTANGAWRRHPALLVYLLLILAQSVTCWALWTSHAYALAYYGFNAAEQLTQLWIMIELSISVTAASPAVRRFIHRAIPLIASFALAWPISTLTWGGIVQFCSDLDCAVGLAWAATFIVALVAIALTGVQFSHGARGIAAGFLLELLTSNLAASLYASSTGAAYLGVIKLASYGASILIWGATLASPYAEPRLALLHAIPQSAQELTAVRSTERRGKGHRAND